MYQFKIVKVQEGGYKFELEGIKILVDGYSINDNVHVLKNPTKAFAFFNVEQDIYGISNEPLKLGSAEALYDAIYQQYNVFNSTSNSQGNSLKRTA